MTIDPGAARLLRMLAGAIQPDGGQVSPQARRQALIQLAALTADPVSADVIAEPLLYQRRGPNGPLALRRYRCAAPGESPSGLIVYLHGGGWVSGDLETHDGVCRNLALHSGCQVIAADYRRPPEHRFPAAVNDAADVVVWARSRAAHFGVNPNQIVLAGDSAGANLAAAATGLLTAQGRKPISLLVLLCPILEMEPVHPSRIEFAQGFFLDQAQMAQDMGDYLHDLTLATSPLASPLRITDVGGFPETHLHLAQYDPFRDEGVAFADRLRAAGVPVKAEVYAGMIHYFYALPRTIPKGRAALAQIGAAIKDALERP